VRRDRKSTIDGPSYIRRARNLVRKKMQREGLLPMKARVGPRGPGKSPARGPRLINCRGRFLESSTGSGA
jgi:hypothetical protein